MLILILKCIVLVLDMNTLSFYIEYYTLVCLEIVFDFKNIWYFNDV